MNHTDFFAQVKAGEIARCYLLYGPEALVAHSALTALRAKVLPVGMEALSETVLQNPAAREIIEACETLPMMSERRLVVVRDSALLTGGRSRDEAGDSEQLIAYLPNIPETCCLVFYVEGPVDGRKRLTVALKKQAAVVEFAPLGDAELTKWILGRFQKTGKRATPQLAGQLAFTAGRDLTMLSGEIEKLVATLGEREELTRQDIDQVVTRTMECTIFQLVDAIVARREAQAFSLYQYMMEHGESRLGILAMLMRQLRLLFYIRRLGKEGVPRDKQMKQLSLPGFAYTRALDQLKGFTGTQLAEGMRLCLQTDFAVKSGRMREEFALDRVILTLCSARAGNAR